MTDANEQNLKQLLFGDLEQELATTRRVLDRVPEEHLGWRPHEKSMTLGTLATHVASLCLWPTSILREEFFDIAAPMPRLEAAKSHAEILGSFEHTSGALRDVFAATPDAELLATWELRNGEQVMVRSTRAAAVRTFGLSHIIHHRGQLTVYLRLLNVSVPSVYGPSADEG
jgi:uncharacterized damage-inducible protein DinB